MQSLDLAEHMRELAGESASIKRKYGGLEVTVHDNQTFPWGKALAFVTDIGHDVWLNRQDGLIVIHTKPPAI